MLWPDFDIYEALNGDDWGLVVGPLKRVIDKAHVCINVYRCSSNTRIVIEDNVVSARGRREKWDIQYPLLHVSAVVVAVRRVTILPRNVILFVENERFNPVAASRHHREFPFETCILVSAGNGELEGMESAWLESECHIARRLRVRLKAYGPTTGYLSKCWFGLAEDGPECQE